MFKGLGGRFFRVWNKIDEKPKPWFQFPQLLRDIDIQEDISCACTEYGEARHMQKFGQSRHATMLPLVIYRRRTDRMHWADINKKDTKGDVASGKPSEHEFCFQLRWWCMSTFPKVSLPNDPQNSGRGSDHTWGVPNPLAWRVGGPTLKGWNLWEGLRSNFSKEISYLFFNPLCQSPALKSKNISIEQIQRQQRKYVFILKLLLRIVSVLRLYVPISF